MADVVEFAIEHEAWNVYHLEDGSTLRLRIVMTGVCADGVDDAGRTKYKIDHATLTVVEPATTNVEGEKS